MNKTIDTILHRRSIRSYKTDSIPPEILDLILHAGCAAPYGGPSEPWRFLVIQGEGTKRRLLEGLKRGIDCAHGGPPKNGYWCTQFAEAPVVIVVAFKPTSMGEYPERVELGIGVASAACAIENMLLASASLGLASSWFGPLPEAKEEFEAILDIKPPWEFLAFVAIGKSTDIRRKETKALGNMVLFIDDTR